MVNLEVPKHRQVTNGSFGILIGFSDLAEMEDFFRCVN